MAHLLAHRSMYGIIDALKSLLVRIYKPKGCTTQSRIHFLGRFQYYFEFDKLIFVELQVLIEFRAVRVNYLTV